MIAMNPRSLLLLVVTVLVAGFALQNWAAFTEPAPLKVGFYKFEAPLGLLLLALAAVAVAALVSYADQIKKNALIEAGLTAKELQTQRQLADKAEASRFTNLQSFLTDEFKQRSEDESAFRERLELRLNTLEKQIAAVADSNASPQPKFPSQET